MNKILLKPAFIALSCISTAVIAGDLKGGCTIKAENIQRQIEYAKAHGNTHRVAGLEKALAEVNAHCTDTGLKSDLNAKVKEKEQKVAERKAELQNAQAKGDQKKIARKRSKVTEAEQELKEAQETAAQYLK